MPETAQSYIEPWLNIILSLKVSTYVAIAGAIIAFLSFISVLGRFFRS